MPRVLIADRNAMVRKLLEIFIDAEEHYQVISEGVGESSQPESVDIALVGADQMNLVTQLKQNHPGIRIIVITDRPEISYLCKARQAGADGFWYMKPCAKSLLDIMQRVLSGETVYPDQPMSVQLGLASSADFSERELEVLKEVVRGETDSAIAETLFMSLRTVKAHIRSLRDKTGFRNRTELAVQARGCGLVICDAEPEYDKV